MALEVQVDDGVVTGELVGLLLKTREVDNNRTTTLRGTLEVAASNILRLVRTTNVMRRSRSPRAQSATLRKAGRATSVITVDKHWVELASSKLRVLKILSAKGMIN